MTENFYLTHWLDLNRSNITDARCRQSVKVSRDLRVRAEWPAKLDVILK